MKDKLPTTTGGAVAEKPKRISAKIKAAIEAMVRGDAKNITAAAKIAGLSREHLTRELGRPHIAEYLRVRVLKNLSVHAARAGATKVALLDSGNEMVRDRASSFVLALAGIAPQTMPVAPAAATPGVVIQIISREQAVSAIDVEPIAAAHSD